MEEADSPGPPKSHGDIGAAISSDQLDHVSLARRRAMLLANKLGIVVKEEDKGCDSLDVFSLTPACSSREAGIGFLEQERNHECGGPAETSPETFGNKIVEYSAVDGCLQNGTCSQDVGTSRDCLSDCLQKITSNESNDNFAQVGELDASICASPHSSARSEVFSKVQEEYSDKLLLSVGGGIDSSSGVGIPTVKFKNEIWDHIADDPLDHIVLKERRRMLLSRKLKLLGLAKPVLEGCYEALFGDHVQQGAVKAKEEAHVVIEEPLTAKNNDRICSSVRKSMESNAYEGKDVPMYTDDMNDSSLSTSVKIKDEPQDDNCHKLDRNARDTVSFNISAVITKSEICNELDEDEADHMCLGDRVKLLRSDDSELTMSRNYISSKKSVQFSTECGPIASEPAKAFSINRPRKRRKTATDSVETALEEDAPGLLRVLVEKGISVDEIKLYGETESDEALEESSSDSFSELQSVISKIFTQRHSFLKFSPIRYPKGARASYCLACLISLVEQTRYLHFRKWPVEWGWCRDLHSFIFIFERHNRIVLERPEYGYATYFFELVDYFPIDWQIKRLVTAMKLTTCSRISLIENKALLVGEDLTEGEAKVLIGYGWVPNSGLGTMLRYCDRVVHDRINEKETSEWRSKIGKLLMDGYNGGTMVATNIPEKVVEYRDSQNAQIKLEL